MSIFKINKILYLLLFLVSFSTMMAQSLGGVGGGTSGTPGAYQPPKPGGGTSGGTTNTPGAPSKTPIDIYVVGLGAMGVLLAVGYGRKYYSTNKL